MQGVCSMYCRAQRLRLIEVRTLGRVGVSSIVGSGRGRDDSPVADVDVPDRELDSPALPAKTFRCR